MAGLLAWAADVVAGNGVNSQQESEERPRVRLTVEQQQEVRQLEGRAAAVQHTIEHLRHRIPPPDISRSLPQLHADSLAAHSALTLELNAHQNTQKEAEIRQASLEAENAEYTKAIVSVQRQIQEKLQERSLLHDRLQEFEQEESTLRVELDRLQGSLTEKEVSNQSVLQDGERAGMTVLASSDKALMEAEQLQRTRTELRFWEEKLAQLEQEWSALLQQSSRWPSPAQREKELERRLRSLAEQLVSKQVQADAWTKERRTMELRLSQLTEMRRQVLHGNGDPAIHRTRTGRLLTNGVKHTANLGTREGSRTVWGIDDKWRRLTGRPLYSSFTVRIIIVVYLVCLHVIAFAVVSFTT